MPTLVTVENQYGTTLSRTETLYFNDGVTRLTTTTTTYNPDGSQTVKYAEYNPDGNESYEDDWQKNKNDKLDYETESYYDASGS